MIRCLAIALLLCASMAQAQVVFEEEDATPPLPPEAPKPETWSPPQVDFRLVTRLAFDTAHEGGGENVASLYRFALASIRTERGLLKLKLSARLRWVTTVGGLPFDRRRSAFEPMLGESSISARKWGIDWTAGFLDIAWGQNVAFSPADVLTPVDLRDGPLPTTDARLATPAVRARGSLGPIRWDAVYLPVHMPSRLPLLGNDWSPFPLSSSPIASVTQYIDPSLYPLLEANPTVTALPHADLSTPQGGLRLTTRAGAFDFALSWAEFFDRQPMMKVSSDALELQENLNRGTPIFTATFQRTRVFAFDAAWQSGRLRLTLDAGFSPKRVMPLRDLTSTTKPMASGVLGFEWEGPPILAGGIYTVAVLNVRPEEKLLFFESSQRNVASLSLAYLTAQERFLDERLQVSLTGMVTQHGDFLAQPRLGWRIRDAHTVSVGAVLVGGQGALGKAYRRNSEAYAEYVLQL